MATTLEADYSLNTTVPDSSDDKVVITILRTIFITVNAIFTILANAFCICVIQRVRQVEEGTKLFAISLAIVDLLVGILTVTSIVPSALNYWPFGDTFCRIVLGAGAALTNLSVIFLIYLGVDRLIAVKVSLRYNSLVTKTRALIMSLTAWVLVAAFYALISLGGTPVEYRPHIAMCTYVFVQQNFGELFVISSIVYFIPIAAITGTYLSLILAMVKQKTKIRRNIPHGPKPHFRGSVLMFTFACFFFVIAWTPLIIGTMYESDSEQRMSPSVDFIVTWLMLSNSWWNVVIFARSNKSFRNTAMGILRPNVIQAVND